MASSYDILHYIGGNEPKTEELLNLSTRKHVFYMIRSFEMQYAVIIKFEKIYNEEFDPLGMVKDHTLTFFFKPSLNI